jgi:leucyl-tRNA synthetase
MNDIKNQKSKVSNYNPQEIEPKWQKVWQEEKINEPNMDTAKNPFYNLMMFPYPSAEGLHMGSVRTFSGVDIYGRFMRMQGHSVFEPFGLDGFGIHAENYALKINKHPMDYSKVTESNFYHQMQSLGTIIDWSRTVETYKPDYYKWTQWLFVELFKQGLAYRKKQEVNYCPSCKTVLADEQVIDGKCERCGSTVEKKQLEQWFFKITHYSERLLSNIEKLNWSEKVKIAQKQWIGKKEGMLITHRVVGMDIAFETFTAYPAWSFADTFIVIAPEHPLVNKLVAGTEHEKAAQVFKKDLESFTNAERMEDKLEKKGVFTGRYAKDPFGGPDMPIWLVNFALMDFGTGIVRCSAHDPRDFDFAKKYDIPLKEVVKRETDKPVNAHTNKGKLIDSGPFTGKQIEAVMSQMIDWIEKEDIGKRVTTYHLRDWLISRQRYWGSPIPMIFCSSCYEKGDSWFTSQEAESYHREISNKEEKIRHSSQEMVGWYPEENLPVVLPYVEDFKPIGTGESPLSKDQNFSKVNCPGCRMPAKRETDVSDTFLDSAWYFLRYPSTDIENAIYDIDRTKKWLPVNMYIGGAEHSVLHLF